MIKETTVRKYGGSLGVTLPKAMMDDLGLSAGSKLYVLRSNGDIVLTPHNPHFARLVEAEEEFSQQYQNALRELAK